MNIDWKIRVSIFTNSLILKQLGLAIGIPFGILIVFLIWNKAFYGLILIFLLFAMTALFIFAVYGGTYDAHFVLNEKGILCENQKKQAKRVKIVSAIVTIMGLLLRKPTVAGAGLLSSTKIKNFIPWSSVRKVKYFDRQRHIIIYGGFTENIALFCSPENYLEVKAALIKNIPHKNNDQKG